MNEEVVGLWVVKADHDLKIGKSELETPEPATDAICFHMQQCVEKYLKAFLVSNGHEISRTHVIPVLLKQCADIDDSFLSLENLSLQYMSKYAVELRYPDDFYMPRVDETKEAVRKAEEVRAFVYPKLGLGSRLLE